MGKMTSAIDFADIRDEVPNPFYEVLNLLAESLLEMAFSFENPRFRTTISSPEYY
jgi:hypothetical protein